MSEERDMKKAVLISGFGWYESRLKPIRELLESDGYETVSYLSDFDHRSKSYITDKNPECKYIHVLAYEKNLSISRLLSHFVFGEKLKKVLSYEKPDLIYCMLPPNSAAKHCLKYKKMIPKCKYYVDLIDLWPESMPIRRYKKNIIFKQWSKLRDDSLLVADHVFTECDLYQEKLNKYINAQNATTLHLFREIIDEEEVLKCISEKMKRVDSDNISLCYLGSINHLIDIDKICLVIRKLISSGKSVEFRVIGRGESKDALIKSAKFAGAEVKYYGPIYEREEKLKILGMCDYGFNIMKDSVAVGLTVKSVDYFSMGIPIINNIKGDTWRFVECEAIGINYKNEIDEFNLDNSAEKAKNAFQCFRNHFTRNAFKRVASDVICAR